MGFWLVLFRRDPGGLFDLDGIRIFWTQSLMEVGGPAAGRTVCLDASFTGTRKSIAPWSHRVWRPVGPTDHCGMDRCVHCHENN
jgi:hypothetical protein